MVTACDVEGDGGTDDVAMGAQGGSGRVVLVGEMGETGPLEVSVASGSEEVGGFEVGEVSARAFDSVFNGGRVGAAGEHAGVIVALDEDGVEGLDEAIEAGEDVAEVGEDTEAVFSVVDDEGDAIGAVVCGGDGVDGDAIDGDGVAGAEVFDGMDVTKGIVGPGGAEGLGGGVHGEVELSIVDSGAADMVGVVVGDDERVNAIDVAVEGTEAKGCLSAADAGVEEETDAHGFDVGGVAVRSGLEGDDEHGKRIMETGEKAKGKRMKDEGRRNGESRIHQAGGRYGPMKEPVPLYYKRNVACSGGGCSARAWRTGGWEKWGRCVSVGAKMSAPTWGDQRRERDQSRRGRSGKTGSSWEGSKRL